MGWLSKRGETWHFHWWERREGRRVHRARSTGVRVKSIAQKIATKWDLEIAAAKHGIDLGGPDLSGVDAENAIVLTVPPSECLERFLEHEQARYSAHHAQEYRYMLESVILPEFGGAVVTKSQINDFLAGQRSSGKASRTCNKYLTALRKLLDWAIENGYSRRSHNPAKQIRPFDTRDARIPAHLTLEQFHRLRDAAHGQTREIIIVAALTGLRMNEIFHLRGEDADLENGLVHVRGREDWQPKTKRYRAVPMHPEVRRLFEVRTVEPDSLAFPGKDGRSPLTHIKRSFASACERAGVNVTFHGLRHTFAFLLAETADSQVVKEALGHSNIHSTMRYIHEHPELVRKAIESIG